MFARAALILVSVAAFSLVVLSIWHHFLYSVIFWLAVIAFLTAPIWICVLGVLGYRWIREQLGGTPSLERRNLQSLEWKLTAAIVALAGSLVVLDIPLRIAVFALRHRLESYVERVSENARSQRIIAVQIGPFGIDNIVGDNRGGVYFRTGTLPDGIGPDTISFGIAHEPNHEGTPFGRKGYCYSWLLGDWYSFSASDDY